MTTNERLRGAMLAAGLTTADLADKIGVDPKTVERWVSQGRQPHRTHRLKVAHILSQDDAYLWPSTKHDARSTTASMAELVQLYPNRGSLDAGAWQHFLASATSSIDLLAYAASFLHDAIPDFHDALSERARAGVRVRLLFGDPESDAVRLRGEEEGIGKLLASRCHLTWAYYEPLLDVPGIEARAHGTTLYASIFRFDDTLLANPHTLGQPASQSPILHLQRIPGGRLFDHHMKGFDKAWDGARPMGAASL